MVLRSFCSSVLGSVVLLREVLGEELPFLAAGALGSSSAMASGSWRGATRNSAREGSPSKTTRPPSTLGPPVLL